VDAPATERGREPGRTYRRTYRDDRAMTAPSAGRRRTGGRAPDDRVVTLRTAAYRRTVTTTVDVSVH
jgi:hypothetical protein